MKSVSRRFWTRSPIDVLNTPKEDTWAVNYLNGIYQYVKHGYVLQFDGETSKAMYELEDSMMERNLIGEKRIEKIEMERELKAIIQQYMERMTQDRLRINKEESGKRKEE